jgi:hypothetical protein
MEPELLEMIVAEPEEHREGHVGDYPLSNGRLVRDGTDMSPDIFVKV